MDILKTEKSKKILFNVQFHWNFSAVDYSLAMALRQRGHSIAMVACGGLDPYCEMQTHVQERQDCRTCTSSICEKFTDFNLPYYMAKDHYTGEEAAYADRISRESSISDLLQLNIKGVAVGKHAKTNLFHYYRGYTFEIAGEKEKVFRRMINSGILIALATERIVDDFNPDIIATVNGKTMQWAPYVDLARQNNITFVTYEDLCNFMSPSGAIIEVNGLAHEQRIDSVWQEESKIALSDQQRQQLYDHFKLWSSGKHHAVAFNQDLENDANMVKEQLGLRHDAPVVSLFPNVSWDASSVGFDTVFESMYHWPLKIVDYAQTRPDIEFVIRAHPAEVSLGELYKSTTPVCEEIRKRYPVLPANVKLIDNTSNISSYTVGQLSDIVMVYTSTMGIEFALRGKLPWVAANPYYSGKGFTLDLTSPEHMIALLDNNHFDNKLNPDQIELAERFAHIVRFRRIFLFPYIDFRKCTFTPPNMDVFKPGGNPVIDNICNYILTGKSLLDIGTNHSDRSDQEHKTKRVIQEIKPVSETTISPEYANSFIEKLDCKLGSLPAEEASVINTHIKDKSYLHNQTVSLGYPMVWEMETTNRCAMKCTHCIRSYKMTRQLGDMDFNLLTNIVDQCRVYGQKVYGRAGVLNYIHFGEPALYHHFEESIRYAKDKGFRITVSSTSSAFNDRAIKAAVDTKLDELWLIFDGMDDKTFKKVRGPAASYTKGIEQFGKFLNYMAETNTPINYKTVMIKHPYNRHQWAAFKEFFSKRNIPYYLGHFSTFGGRVKQLSDLQNAIADDPGEAKEIKRVAELNKNMCRNPWHCMSVLYDGRVVPCCRDVNGDYVLGDLSKESLVDVWNGDRMRQLRTDFINGNYNNPLCHSCKEKSLEIGLPQAETKAEELYHQITEDLCSETVVARKTMSTREKIVLDPDEIIPNGDPSAILFKRSNKLFRAITNEKESFYRQLLTEPMRSKLIDAGLVISNITPYYTDTNQLIIEHKVIEPVTYQFEWTCEMLKKSTLFFCDFVEKLASYGLGLKDAHGYNILFDYSNNPYFIDLTSIEPLKETSLIQAEFNRYFLNPLYGMLINKHKEVRHLTNMGGYDTGTGKGGIDNEEILNVLTGELRERYLQYRQKENIYRNNREHLKLIELYREEVNGINLAVNETCWATYYTSSKQYPGNIRFDNLEPDENWEPKQLRLHNIFQNHPGRTVLDIGCSAGWFSRLAANNGKKVLAMDCDEDAIGRVYEYACRNNQQIHPIYSDFSQMEQLFSDKGIKHMDRFRSDIVLALALIHHLVFRADMTFEDIARILHRLTKDTLVVEFMDHRDGSIKLMLKEKMVPWYNGKNFKLALEKYFKEIEIVDSAGNFDRYLIICKQRVADDIVTQNPMYCEITG